VIHPFTHDEYAIPQVKTHPLYQLWFSHRLILFHQLNMDLRPQT